MIPSPCGSDVCVFVQKSECSSDSTFSKDESTKISLISADNKINVFQNGSSLKTFKYDNICDPDSKVDVLESLAKSVTKDVVESINRITFLYKLYGNDVTYAVDMMTFCSFVLNTMSATVNSEKSKDISLHVSCLEVNNEGIIDLIQKSDAVSNDLKVFELANQSNLIERVVTNTEDIDKIIEAIFQKNTPTACLDCRHTVVLSTVIVKTRNFDGFEILKAGRFILVDLRGCMHFLKEVTNYICSRRESFYLIPNASPIAKDPKLWNCNLSEILKNFLSNSKISIMMSLPSTLFDLEPIHFLEIVSEMRNLRLKPVINERLILRELLNDYADQIKALEKDLLVLKNNNGILIDQQKYRSLKNRLLLSETQLRDVHEEKKAYSDSLNSKKEVLARLEEEIKLRDIKTEEEMQKLKCSNVLFEETKQKKIALNLSEMEKVDACVTMNNLINSNMNYIKTQKSNLVKIKFSYEKSSSNARSLNEDINNHIMNTHMEQDKLKDKIESLLVHLKKILLNSTIQLNNFMLNANEFYQKFEETLRLWKQNSSNLNTDFHNFMEGSLQNSLSLKQNLVSELVSLNCNEDAIIEIIKKNETETLELITSCSTKIQTLADKSIKLLYEFLYLLNIVQGKVKEQLKKMESTINCHSNDRMKFLDSTKTTMESIQKYFNAHLELSTNINLDIFGQHQKLMLCAKQEFTRIKEAFNSLKTLFNSQQNFVIDKWQQKQTYMSNVKEIGGVSEALQKCKEEHPVLLDKLRQQSVSSIDEIYSILREQTSTVENLGSQLKIMFQDIESSTKGCSEEHKKRVSQQEIDIRDNLESQNETIRKCMKTTRSQVEDMAQYMAKGLQDINNSFFNVKNLKKSNDINHILELRNYLNDYIRNHANILKLSDVTLQQLPETFTERTENLEESLEFNHEELLSSTPSSNHERSKNLINDKAKFLNRLRKISTIEGNSGYQNILSLDQKSIINASNMSLPTINTTTKVEISKNSSLMHRKVSKSNFMK